MCEPEKLREQIPELPPEFQGYSEQISLGGVSIFISGANNPLATDSNDERRTGPEFGTEAVRGDFLEVVKATTKYVAENDIAAVALIDRGARPLGIGLKKYWKTLEGDATIKQPDVLFIDPNGFKGLAGARFKSAKYVSRVIADELPGLNGHKEKPVLIMDTCIHLGKVMTPTLKVLEKANFEDVHVGVASDNRNFTNIDPDFVAFQGYLDRDCFPFGSTNHSTLVDRNKNGRLYGDRTTDSYLRGRGLAARREITDIIEGRASVSENIGGSSPRLPHGMDAATMRAIAGFLADLGL